MTFLYIQSSFNQKGKFPHKTGRRSGDRAACFAITEFYPFGRRYELIPWMKTSNVIAI
jgi:hypothetical protein